ncbi:hypothetical protein BDB00DRAFT_869077 [Zychaea mexicana]|uniref:uncharacterized protein n=1 Tax=Zychaea mexicana TaxID=64656 RepID=UPI0022FEC33B|nr:uncharacterized protein BDB00DRAFT_869077 [Zychaea mexicana]KAI9496847.1 hypothetical protein BDB00DRAFT_869077 [Zychaea mexicana]
MTVTNAPLAGWLAKLTTLPLGRTRWQHRFFVLLDSELRFYKDEHADSATHVLNLRHVRDVVQIALPNHSFCIRLQPCSPTVTTKTKPWTLACSSQVDLETWIRALQKRLTRSSCPSSPAEQEVSVGNHKSQKKKRPTNSWFSQPSSSSLHSHDGPTDDSNETTQQGQQNKEFYHAITSSHNITVLPRIRKQPPPSLSRRRGIYLAPLVIESSPFSNTNNKNDTDSDFFVHALSSFTSSSTASSSTDELMLFPTPPPHLPSNCVDPSKEEQEEGEIIDRGRSLSAPAIFQKRKDDGETSPTFLLYKERFHLC